MSEDISITQTEVETTQTEVESFTVQKCFSDDICISSMDTAEHDHQDGTTSFETGKPDIQEILHEQLHRAQENLAAHHRHVLALLASSLQSCPSSRSHPEAQVEVNGSNGLTMGDSCVSADLVSAGKRKTVQISENRSSCYELVDETTRGIVTGNLPGMPDGTHAAIECGEDNVPRGCEAHGDTFSHAVVPAPPDGSAPQLVPPKQLQFGRVSTQSAAPEADSKTAAPEADSKKQLSAEVKRSSVASVKRLPTQAFETGSVSLLALKRSRRESDASVGSGQSTMTTADHIKFEVLPVWRKDNKQLAAQLGKPKLRKLKHLSSRSQSALDMADSSIMDAPGRERGDFRIIMNPNSTQRCIWDVASLLLVIYDMVVIPLSFFEMPESFFLNFMAWVTRVFWTLDIFASLTTGYLKADGHVEMHFMKIAKRYVLSWFLLDLLIVGIDWFEVMVSEMDSMGAAKLVRSSRTIRIIRLVRLLRLVRMQTVLRQFVENIQSEQMMVVADIIKIIVLITGMAHLIACIWYGIGAMDEEHTWVRRYGYERLGLGYQYTTSLHWSLSQFAGGMDEVTACNNSERVYAIVIFLFSFIVSAVFVSHITSSMTQLHMITSQQALQVSVLRKYFQQNSISKKLSLRVLRNARKAAAEQQRFMLESSVELLGLVSEPLRVELHFEMFSPVLHVHHFFKQYIDECPQVMRKVCHCAISMSAVSPGDVLFNNGEIPRAPMMYFVVSGTLKYTTSLGEGHSIEHGDWLSEGTLWTPWMHRGNLEAMVESRLCKIDSKKFQEIVLQFEHTGFNPKERAAFFVNQLNILSKDSELTDLDPSSVNHDDDSEPHTFLQDMVPGTIARMASRRTSSIFWHHSNSKDPHKTRNFGGSHHLAPIPSESFFDHDT